MLVNQQKEKDHSHVRKMDGAQTQRMIVNVKRLVAQQKNNFHISVKVKNDEKAEFRDFFIFISSFC